MNKLFNKKAFSLIELLIGSTVLILGVTAAQKIKSSVSNSVAASDINNSALAEHKMLNTMIRTIPVEQTESISCPQPHPWYKIQKDPETGGYSCAIAKPAPAKAYNAGMWNDLSQAYFALTLQTGQKGGTFTPTDQIPSTVTFYASQVGNRLNSLGCRNCHNGNPAIPGNFTSFSLITNPNSPELSVFGLGSPLGRRLLRNQIPVQSLRAQVTSDTSKLAQSNVNHVINFASAVRLLNSEAANFEWNCALGTFRAPYERVVAGCVTPTCPGGIVVNSTCVCERTVSNQKKTNVSGCEWRTHFGCIYDPELPANPAQQCEHGQVMAGSYAWPIRLALAPDFRFQRCRSRYTKTFTTPVLSDGSKRTYNYQYAYWECQDTDGDKKFETSQLEVSYSINTSWTNSRDSLFRQLSSSGALK